MIISISGCDGAGKSTQGELLAKKISNEKNLKMISIFEIIGECGDKSISELNDIFEVLNKYDVILSRFYLKSDKLNELQNNLLVCTPKVFNDSMLIKQIAEYAKRDSDLWFTHVINKLILNGKIIIFDRYFYDEIAYRSLYNYSMQAMEKLYEDSQIPDFSFYLKLSNVEEVLIRNKLRKDSKTTLFQNKEKINELINNFCVIARKNGMYVIDGNESKEKITNKIYNIISSKL